mgnify:CR=1 FL=1
MRENLHAPKIVLCLICMTVKMLEQKVKSIEERLGHVEMGRGVLTYSGSKKTEIQDALRSLSGLWKNRPRTTADLRRVRRHLGLD